MLVFTLMFAVMSSAWNLVGGFAGYPSLGHAAFFGIGAYGVGLHFQGQHLSTGYEPFLWLPVIGAVGALIGWPIALISMRTRADVFAIVTITFLFVVQTLAFNLRGLTGGSQGLALPVAPFPAATFERPFYYVLVVLLALAMGLTFAHHAQQGRPGAGVGACRRGQGARDRRARHRREGAGLLGQRRADDDGRRRLGLLRELHLPAVRGGSAHHHRASC